MIRLRPLVALASLGLVPSFAAQAVPRPQPTFVRGVGLDRAGATKGSLYLRDGSIVAVLDADAPPPAGTRVVEGTGLICLPAFLDAYARQGVTTTPPVKDQDLPPDEQADVGIDMRVANRKGIQPAFLAARALALTKEQSEAWRKSGFGAVLVAPGGELLSGSSVLAVTREAAMRDIVLREDVFAHAAFNASGGGYPSTLMGYFAQLRQFFLDSQRQLELARRNAEGRPGPRPPFDAELAAGARLVRGEQRLLCEAEGMEDFARWFRLAREFGLELGFVGGREAWRAEESLKAASSPLVVTLDWGKEVDDPRPKEEKKASEAGSEESADAAPAEASTAEPAPVEPVWEYTEPYAVRLEKRRLWEEKRDGAVRLHAAGVPFAFGSASRKPGELLASVRTLVKSGLPAEAALQALTQGAAELLGVERRLGTVAAGKDATFALWRADPLTDEKATVAWMFVDGFASEFKEEKKKEKAEGKPDEGLDATGGWKLTFEVQGEGVKEAQLTLEMDEKGAVTGSIAVENPMGGGSIEADVNGVLDGAELELSFTLAFGEFKLDTTLTATLSGDTLDGKTEFSMPGGDEPMSQSFTGKREPELLPQRVVAGRKDSPEVVDHASGASAPGANNILPEAAGSAEPIRDASATSGCGQSPR
jgi:hypothetical protein